MPRYYIFWAILLLCCGYALWQGRKYERVAAVTFLGASVVSLFAHRLFQIRYLTLDVSEVLIDSAVLVSLLTIALLSDRFWPLWAAGFQLVGSMAHLLKTIDMTMAPWGYAVAARFWSYPILLVLFIGVWRQHRRTILEDQSITPT